MTSPGYPKGTGQPVAPPNAPAARQLGLGVQPGTPSIIRARLVIVFGSGEGVFVYNGTPALGNPPIFWATSASTDPYGNAIGSTVGVAGTGSFEAGDTIINASGTFVYSGTPAAGNLLVSMAPAAGTDAFGNAYVKGLATYQYSAGTLVETIEMSQDILSWINANTGYVLDLAQDGTNGNLFMRAAGSLTVPAILECSRPGALSNTEAWHSMPAMSGGWTASGFAKYRYTPLGDLQVAFQDLAPGTVADGTAIWAAGTFSGAYQPAANHRVVAYSDSLKTSGSSFEATALQFGSDGSVSCYGVSTAATRLDLFATIPVSA